MPEFPIIAGKMINRRGDVVALIAAVAGEVLDRDADAQLLALFGVSGAEGGDPGGVGTEGTGVGDGVSKVIVDVDDRGESVVRADRFALAGAEDAEASGVFDIVGRGDLERRADEGALVDDAVAALFEVRGDQHRDLALFAEHIGGVDRFLSGAGPVHDAAGVQGIQQLVDRRFVVVAHAGEEEGLDLLVLGHFGEGLFHPGDVLVIQVKGFCSVIKHFADPPFTVDGYGRFRKFLPLPYVFILHDFPVEFNSLLWIRYK